MLTANIKSLSDSDLLDVRDALFFLCPSVPSCEECPFYTGSENGALYNDRPCFCDQLEIEAERRGLPDYFNDSDSL